MAKNKSQYDSTLNLPKTLFEMRAGLPKKEPAMLKDWEENDLYNRGFLGKRRESAQA